MRAFCCPNSLVRYRVSIVCLHFLFSLLKYLQRAALRSQLEKQMFKQALAATALAALAACGGGGGGSGGGVAIAVDPKPATPVLQAGPVYPNCDTVAYNHIACDLVPGEISAPVPAGMFGSFTNRTGQYLQINEINGYTAERQYWSEYCAYLGDLTNIVTFQASPGKGEVGCSTKNVGEDYTPIRFGDGTGLSVAPGEMVMLNAHTEPAATNHTYSLRVAAATTGLHSWRQPRVDRVIPCNDGTQWTDMAPWQNDTGRDLHLTGASIYAESPSSRTPNTLNGACIYVFTADGAQKYTNCDGLIRARGEVNFPLVTIAPGESVGAQATNACSTGSHWNWVAFLRVW